MSSPEPGPVVLDHLGDAVASDRVRALMNGLEPFGRYGNDIVLVWDAEAPGGDVSIIAGLSVAQTLYARGRPRSDTKAANFDSIERAILEIEKQARGLDEAPRSAERIKSGSEKILRRVEIMRRAVGDQVEALTGKVRDLQRLLAEPRAK